MKSPSMQLVSAVFLTLMLVPAVAAAQGRALPALSSERALIGGSPTVLDVNAAQMRFSLDGAVERTDVDEGRRELRLSWDTAFSLSDIVEIGVRLEMSYRDDAQETWLGPEMWGGALRLLAHQGDGGDSLTVGFALGQRLIAPGSTLVELDAVYGIPIGNQWRFDIAALGWAELIQDSDKLFGAGAALGPLWRPLDRLKIGVDLGGRIGTIEGAEETFWDARTALRLGVLIGESHELALSGRRTIAGERVDEETALMLTWQFSWMTENGFLHIDDDGGPSPEPEE